MAIMTQLLLLLLLLLLTEEDTCIQEGGWVEGAEGEGEGCSVMYFFCHSFFCLQPPFLCVG